VGAAVSVGGAGVAFGSSVAEGVTMGSGFVGIVGDGCPLQAARKIAISVKTRRGRALAMGKPLINAIIWAEMPSVKNLVELA
jgi:hypothetical protein